MVYSLSDMQYARPILFYTFIAIFLATALVTLLGLVGTVQIPEAYLDKLVVGLIMETVGAVIALFATTNWFGASYKLKSADEVKGAWWQFIWNEGENAVSFVDIKFSREQQQFIMEGHAYNKAGDRWAEWYSKGTAMNAVTNELWFVWSGDIEGEIADQSGLGFIKFSRSSGGRFNRGSGWFTTGDIDSAVVTDRIKVTFVRATDDEARVMRSNDTGKKRETASRLVADWKRGGAAR